MKRALLILLIGLLVLSPQQSGVSYFQDDTQQHTFLNNIVEINHLLSTAAGGGNTQDSTIYASRSISSEVLQIKNSYSSINQHTGQIDLTEYLLPGWSLYQVEIDVTGLTAIAERESTEITPNSYDMEMGNVTNLIIDALYQEFYNQPHNGKLENYSILYLAPYLPTQNGEPYLVVRSNYSDSNTNQTGWITPFNQGIFDTSVTHDCSSDGAILSASTPYYVVIDYTGMTNTTGTYPTFYWRSSSIVGDEAGYRIRDDTWYQYVGTGREVADLDYTYTPWNLTTNSELIFKDPTNISLTANTSSLFGDFWTFTDSNNVTSIEFSSNQSVQVDYTMNLWYKQGTTAITNWEVTESGSSVKWNSSVVVEYPSVVEDKYLNFTIPSSWAPVGLYNTSQPSENHSYYTYSGNTIRCYNMRNDTWTLRSESHNHLSKIETYDNSDNSPITYTINSNKIMEINLSVTEEDLNLVTSGTTNLTIWKDNSVIHAPSNETVVLGETSYVWDISLDITENGRYRIESFWTNGTDSGYLTKEIVIFHSTTLIAESYEISGYTDNSLFIKVDFSETFTPQAIDGSMGDVQYSFDGAANVSMTDHSNGTWTASPDTTGKSPGTYVIDVYASGFALENQSLQITAILIHETSPLIIQWSNDDNITYVDETILSVTYREDTGENVTNAWVNATIGLTTWNLTWNPITESYQITFNGTDTDPGFGTHSLTISAWKEGYQSQTNDSETITLREEPTSISIGWSNSDTITYLESTILYVSYMMSNGTSIPDAVGNVTINGITHDLVYDSLSKTYNYTIVGNDAELGLGVFSISIKIEKTGYGNQTDVGETLTVSEEPVIFSFQWTNGNNISFVDSSILQVNYSTSEGPITSALVNITIGSTTWNLTWNGVSEFYEIQFNGSDIDPGFGNHSIVVKAALYGYESVTNTTEYLVLREEFTSLEIQWTNTNSITYIGFTVLNASYLMSNGTPITGANLNVTIDTKTWLLDWNQSSQSYILTFNGTDDPPSFGVHSLIVLADKYGYKNGTQSDYLTINLESTSLSIDILPDTNVTYTEFSTIIVRYEMSNTSEVLGALVNVTLGTSTWNLTWDPSNEDYRIRINGSDNPPGFGTFDVIIKAQKYGFIQQLNSSLNITLSIEPTLFSVQWSNTNSPSYFENTTLQVSYTMLDFTPITSAEVNVTIDAKTWLLIWNSTSGYFERVFNGSDSPPGVGTHGLSISCGLFGYETQVNTTEYLILPVIPTEFDIIWSNGYDISFVESTTLKVNYTMFNGTAIILATVNVTFGITMWNLNWNETSELYEVTFNGDEEPPGINTYNLDIRASKTDFQSWINDTETLTVSEELTSYSLTWTAGDNITYVQTTTLIVAYRMSNTTAIPYADVNVTIGTDTWILDWDDSNDDYRIIFNGTDKPPGFGTHAMVIKADKHGYVGITNTTEELTLREEGTQFVYNWDITYSNNISYLESTILSYSYQMSDGTPIPSAIVNVTVDDSVFNLRWNESSQTYQIQFNGSDAIPGFGTFLLTINSSRYGFISVSDTSEELTIRVEDTTFDMSWSSPPVITYIEETTLRVEYRLRNGSMVSNAMINVTIQTTTWFLHWNSSTGFYEIKFNGTDNSPGIGNHSLTINAWKQNYQARMNSLETLNITEESTSLAFIWSNGDSITYVEDTTLTVNFTMSNGSAIIQAIVNVTIGVESWNLTWNPIDEVYQIQFNGTDDPPGLGTHGLVIQAERFGYEYQYNDTQTLMISGELGQIESKWIDSGSISFIESTILSVNYTMSNGTAIPLALVNVTIGSKTWNLSWYEPSETYQLQFNGSDSLPGLGIHSLTIKADREGFDGVTDTTQNLIINEDITSISVTWTEPYQNNISYFQYTTLQVAYRMSNDSDIISALVNATIDGATWILKWNASSSRYEMQFNGSDFNPGLGTHSLQIKADELGFIGRTDVTQDLIVRKDPASLQVTWSNGNDISYIEQTKVVVYYRMSNGTAIPDGTVNITIAGHLIHLAWNETSEAYEVLLNGSDSPPGIGTFSSIVNASGNIYTDQEVFTQYSVREEATSLSIWWENAATDTNSSFYYTQSDTLRVYYRDSEGVFIPSATQLIVTVNGTQYTLQEASGYYWIEFDYQSDLGYHLVTLNTSKYGYEYSYMDGIHFNITETPTSLFITWDSLTIDYLSQVNLTAQYWDDDSMSNIPTGIVTTNLTIDGGETILLNSSGVIWIGNLTGIHLDIGTHDIVVRAWSYGYEFQSNLSVITVNVVDTDLSSILWEPANVTIEYIDSLNLTLDYTTAYGDVPDTAQVNVTIDGKPFVLSYSGGVWRVSISGIDLGIGIYEAYISAWNYGYESFTNTTYNVNVTLASNSFLVYWTPSDGILNIIEELNVSVVYTSDFQPVDGANVTLTINETTSYPLTYSSIDERWYISLSGEVITLGNWNITIEAGKKGHQNGTEWKMILVHRDTISHSTNWTEAEIDYVSEIVLEINCNSSEGDYINDAIVSVSINSISVDSFFEGTGTYTASFGPLIDPGMYSINLTITGTWFYSVTVILELNVSESNSVFDIQLSDSDIYTDEIAAGSISYEMENGTTIPDTQIQILANDSNIPVTWNTNNWTFSIAGTSLIPGYYNCSINITSFGFTSRFYTFVMTINLIPTEVHITGSSWFYVNDTNEFQIQFIDTRTESFIQDAVLTITWIGQYVLDSTSSEHYLVSLSSIGLEVGEFLLEIDICKEGYSFASINQNLQVRELPLVIITDTSISQYEQEYIRITSFIQDTYHEANVSWLELYLTFMDTDYQMQYDLEVGMYVISLELSSDYSPGEYNLVLYTDSKYFQDSYVDLALTILEKSTYTLEISIPDQAEEGSTITISAALSDGSFPVNMKDLTITLTVSMRNGSMIDRHFSGTTNSEGLYILSFDIPLDTDEISVVAEYIGEIDAWPTSSMIQTIQVNELDTIPNLPLDGQVTISIAIGGSIGLVAILVLIRKRRRIPSIPSSVDKIVASKFTPSSSHKEVISYQITEDDTLQIGDIEDSLLNIVETEPLDSQSIQDYLIGTGIITTIALSELGDSGKEIPPIDDGRKIVEMLMKSDEPLTRAQISKRLDISIHKTRKFVTELLKANDSIVEIREGRSRKIVYKELNT